MKILVQNAEGTSKMQVPYGYLDWLDYWNKHKNTVTYWCKSCGRPSLDLFGGHVHKLDPISYKQYPGLYIIPICPKCNNHYNTTPFWAEEDDLVLIHQDHMR